MKIIKSNLNIFFLIIFFLLFLNYFFSYIFFGKIVIEPHDNLDHLVVYDHIISEIYRGNFDAIKIFLSGVLSWYYLEEIFFPINFLHLIFDNKLFFFSENILKLMLSFVSFYILSKSLIKNKNYSAIISVLYASITQTAIITPGYGLSLLPYFFYLISNNKNLKIKHFLIIFFTGLNTSIIHEFLSMLFIFPLVFILKKKINKKKIFYFLICFSIGVLLNSIPLFLVSILEETQRSSFDNRRLPFLKNFFIELKSLFRITVLNTSLFNIPLKVLYFLIFCYFFFTNDKRYKFILILLTTIFFLKILVGSTLVDLFFNNFFKSFIFLKEFNFTRIDKIFPFLFSVLIILFFIINKNENLKKIFFILSIISIIFLQIAVPQHEILKNGFYNYLKDEKKIELKKSINSNNFLNSFKIINDKKNFTESRSFLKTQKDFESYYRFDDYAEIKKIVKQNRIMSIGLDPMIAVMSNIYVIDGYHTQYPKNYKAEFRKIIKNELEKNTYLKKYFDDWGSKLYAFYDDENNLEIDFNHAKSLGAFFVLSNFIINNENLKLICPNCADSKDLFLYRIL